MDFMTTKEAALKWGLTNRMVQYYCKEGKIKNGEFQNAGYRDYVQKKGLRA